MTSFLLFIIIVFAFWLNLLFENSGIRKQLVKFAMKHGVILAISKLTGSQFNIQNDGLHWLI